MSAKTPAMTEKGWRKCQRPSRMLDWLTQVPGTIYKGRVQQHPRGRRRLRLFGVAVARRVAHLVSDRHLLALLDAAEAFADGVGTPRQLTRLVRQSGVDEFNFMLDDPHELEDDEDDGEV